MGIAYYGNPRSAAIITGSLHRHLARRDIDDPLLRLTEQLEHNQKTAYGETVGLLPLLTAQGAISDALADGNAPELSIRQRRANADGLASLARRFGWRPVRPAAPMRTGICLLRAPGGKRARKSAETVRNLFRNANIAVTVYPHGLVRLSMPQTTWTKSELDYLSHTLAICSLAVKEDSVAASATGVDGIRARRPLLSDMFRSTGFEPDGFTHGRLHPLSASAHTRNRFVPLPGHIKNP
jgi:hypothetical protein